MEKKEIVKKALDCGILLTPRALDNINEETLDGVLKKASRSGKIVLTSNTLSGQPKPELKGETTKEPEPKKTAPEAPKPEPGPEVKQKTEKTLKPRGEETRSDLRPQKPTQKLTERSKQNLVVEVKKFQTKDKLEPQDFAQFYNHKYKGLQQLLLKKVNAVSISKAKGLFSDVSVIGMVRELTPKGFVVEDPTGEIEVISRDKIPADDVIGIKGFVREAKLFPNEFVWPDIPLSREINKIEGATILFAPKPANISGVDVVITENQYPNPAWLTISTEDKKIQVLVFKPENEFTLKRAVAWLKKRHLSHKKEHIPGPEDPYILAPVPDIIWFPGRQEETFVYKGVTMVSTSERFAKVDLGTMKVEFI